MTPIPPNIAHIAFPLLLGNLFNWLLYGVLAVQVYVYYLSFSEDRAAFKCLVYGVLFLETLQTALSGADIYYWFGVGFGDMVHLENPFISPLDTPVFCSIIALLVQGFFCYRIWLFNKSARWLSGLIGCISTIQCGAGIAGGVYVHIHKSFTALPHDKQFILFLWLISAAVADIMIAVAMIILLLRHLTHDQRFTNNVLMRSVRLIVETNSLTAGLALLAVILHAVQPDTDLFTAPTFAIGKIYSNTLLVTLNNRFYLREAKSKSEPPVPNRIHFRPQGRPLTSRADLYTGRPTSDITANDIHLDQVDMGAKTGQL